jgi:hypothetical protein
MLPEVTAKPDRSNKRILLTERPDCLVGVIRAIVVNEKDLSNLERCAISGLPRLSK